MKRHYLEYSKAANKDTIFNNNKFVGFIAVFSMIFFTGLYLFLLFIL